MSLNYIPSPHRPLLLNDSEPSDEFWHKFLECYHSILRHSWGLCPPPHPINPKCGCRSFESHYSTGRYVRVLCQSYFGLWLRRNMLSAQFFTSFDLWNRVSHDRGFCNVLDSPRKPLFRGREEIPPNYTKLYFRHSRSLYFILNFHV